jgi:phosphate transport system permease protein
MRGAPNSAGPFQKKWGRASLSPLEILVRGLLFFCAALSVLTTTAIVIALVVEVDHFFDHVAVTDFLFGTEWSALIEPKKFGILPLLSGTLMIALGASAVALPLGLGAALFLSEYVKGTKKEVMKSILEVLAGIPSVVYGFFALAFVTPQLRQVFEEVQFFNALSASIVVGIMIIPTIASMSHDAFQAVPKELREAGYGLGARKYQVAMTVVFPAALSGVIASVILAFARALGETMAVTLAAGASPSLSWNFFESVQTMTAYIVQVSLGDTPAGTIEYESIFAVGLVLLCVTLVMNIIAQFIVKRFQEKYQ